MRFGTDGLRGVAGSELTPELATALGRVAAAALPAGTPVLVGRDTRRSGPMLVAALAAGLAAEGADVVDLGVLPTPGVAARCAALGTAGAVVSASHNPYADNGVKVLGPGGRKLADEAEEALSAALERTLAGGPPRPRRAGTDLGTVTVDPGATAWYVEHLLATARRAGADPTGLRVVLDCGHGAAAAVAPAALAAAGAEVVATLGAAPDGTNINEGCGSTAPGALAAVTVAHHADLGLAFDGDADRVIAVDGTGEVVDGDRLLALFATDLHRRGRLAGGTVVVTVMTNLGFHRAMEASGIAVRTTAVGDRQVLAALDEGGWSLGGEQSGHIIFRDLATTGDGVLSGLLLAGLVAAAGRPLAELAAASMTRLPQVLRNVAVADRDGLAAATEVWDAVARAEGSLAGRGRVLLRPSGTEQLVRVMAEAPTEEEAAAVVAGLAATVADTLGSR